MLRAVACPYYCAAPDRDSIQRLESQPQSHHALRRHRISSAGPAGPIALPNKGRGTRMRRE
jgi:hypothetical protein